MWSKVTKLWFYWKQILVINQNQQKKVEYKGGIVKYKKEL